MATPFVNEHAETSPTTPLTFTPFTILPNELQSKIWNYAVPGPRIIRVKIFAQGTSFDPNHDHEYRQSDCEIEKERALILERLQFTTKVAPSALLGACKASRCHLLNIYKACLPSSGSGSKIRFNGELDTLLLHSSCDPTKSGVEDFFDLFYTANMRSDLLYMFRLIKHLAISLQGLGTPYLAHLDFPLIARYTLANAEMKTLYLIPNIMPRVRMQGILEDEDDVSLDDVEKWELRDGRLRQELRRFLDRQLRRRRDQEETAREQFMGPMTRYVERTKKDNDRVVIAPEIKFVVPVNAKELEAMEAEKERRALGHLGGSRGCECGLCFLYNQ